MPAQNIDMIKFKCCRGGRPCPPEIKNELTANAVGAILIARAPKTFLEYYNYITNVKNIDLEKHIIYNKHKRKEFVKTTNENVIGIWNLAFGNWDKITKYQTQNAKFQTQNKQKKG